MFTLFVGTPTKGHKFSKENIVKEKHEIRLFLRRGKSRRHGDMKEVLGGKGAGLAEMTRIGLPVPAGFTITTEACDYYLKHDHKFPKELRAEVTKNVARLEKLTGKKLGDANSPLLVSVRSGSARSMPGMMETILNLGLNDTVRGRPCKGHGQRPFRLGCLSPLRADVFKRGDRPAEGRSRSPTARNEGQNRREGRYAGERRRLARSGLRIQGIFQAKDRQGFSRRSRSSNSGARQARCSSPGWAKRRSPTGAWRRLPACWARPSTWCRWYSAIRERIRARAFASRAIPPPARRFSSATFF